MRFLAAFLAAHVTMGCAVLLATLAISSFHGESFHLNIFFYYFLFFGLPFGLIGCLFGEMLIKADPRPSLGIFVFYGALSGALLYILITGPNIESATELGGDLIGILLLGGIGALTAAVFYRIRTHYGHLSRIG